MDHSVRLGVRVYSQSARKKALEMLALTGDFEKSARMSGISGTTFVLFPTTYPPESYTAAS